MKKTFRFILLSTMLGALSARGGNAPELAPLIDVDLSYLSVDLQVPWNGDPFRKVAGFAQVKPTEEKFVLGGIVYSKTEPVAVVNGEDVLVGDEIDGRIVDSIGRNYVVLRKGDSLKELVLPPPEPENRDEEEQ